MKERFEWAVVGAGPSGIATLGILLDAGVAREEVVWIDPEFSVGDFGTRWGWVASNTNVKSFAKYYGASSAFRYSDPARPAFLIDRVAPENICPLTVASQPLQWITKNLSARVQTEKDRVARISPVDAFWRLKLESGRVLTARKIALTIGGVPRQLDFGELPMVPLSTALSPLRIKNEIGPEDYVLVFGSAQSAKSVVENLLALKTRRSILFYRSERSLDRHFGEELIRKFECLPMTSKNLLAHVPHASKAVYAVGFERRHIPIDGLPSNYDYDQTSGEIAPGIYGAGMAFPEVLPFELGQREYRVTAIWPVMKRLQKLVPTWLS